MNKFVITMVTVEKYIKVNNRDLTMSSIRWMGNGIRYNVSRYLPYLIIIIILRRCDAMCLNSEKNRPKT